MVRGFQGSRAYRASETRARLAACETLEQQAKNQQKNTTTKTKHNNDPNMNKAAQKFAQVTALNGVKICHRSIGETSKPAVLMIMGIAAARKSIVAALSATTPST